LDRFARQMQFDTDTRGVAFDTLSRIDSKRAFPLLREILHSPDEHAVLKEKALVALANVPMREARGEVNVALKGVPYRVAVSVGLNMAATRIGGEEMLASVKAGFMPARVLQEKLVLERLRAANIPNLDKQLADLTRGLPPADQKLAELIKQRTVKFTTAKLDKEAGAKLFTKHCGACHKIGEQGGKVGPNLDGIGVRGLERLLEDTLDPNRNVDAAFRARVLNLVDGTTKTGLMLRVEGEVLVMADDQGKEFRVPTKDIEKNRETSLSPMPANFGEVIPEAEFYQLMGYLLDQKKN
jgi:putative heme-binding domain-containing protein